MEFEEFRDHRQAGRTRAPLPRGPTPLELQGRTAILADDGLATGSIMLAAVKALRTRMPAQIVVAIPVAANDTCESLRSEADLRAARRGLARHAGDRSRACRHHSALDGGRDFNAVAIEGDLPRQPVRARGQR
jgi:hypothetical protein